MNTPQLRVIKGAWSSTVMLNAWAEAETHGDAAEAERLLDLLYERFSKQPHLELIPGGKSSQA